MTASVHRVLAQQPVTSLEEYRAAGGGQGLEAAVSRGPEAVIEEIEAAGLRGRGGAGFPTGRKWRAVAANESVDLKASVVVNAAEGEPGSFKDREILRANPYHVIEGALIAARVLDAGEVIVATKKTFERERAVLQHAVDEVNAAGWTDGLRLRVFAGPSEYLYGEETALLETLDGRYPFPRIAPPYRRGLEEVVEHPGDVGAHSQSAAHVEMAQPEGEAPPTLASNSETFANVPAILVNGADWFRSVGTDESPGTVVVTISGCVQHAGVAELAMGTPLRTAIEEIGGGAIDGRTLKAALSGVANPAILADQFDVPLSYEGLQSIGAGLGSAGFIVYDDTSDMVAVAAGIARFLAVESCGQCAACKQAGLAIADGLASLSRSHASDHDQDVLEQHLENVTEGARCNLATQQQVVVRSLLESFPEAELHRERRTPGVEPEPMAALADISGGVATIDAHEARKQPDWTFDEEYSGKWPSDRLDDHRAPDTL
jgi:NADH:ubiquinone oxidoreductase subunit F (NADH-binding)